MTNGNLGTGRVPGASKTRSRLHAEFRYSYRSPGLRALSPQLIELRGTATPFWSLRRCRLDRRHRGLFASLEPFKNRGTKPDGLDAEFDEWRQHPRPPGHVGANGRRCKMQQRREFLDAEGFGVRQQSRSPRLHAGARRHRCGIEISHHPRRGQGWAGVSASGRLGPGRWADDVSLKACLPGSCLGSIALPKPSRRHPLPLICAGPLGYEAGDQEGSYLPILLRPCQLHTSAM